MLDTVLSYMKHHEILPAVYSPFAGQKESGDMLLEDPTVKENAQKNNMGVGQLLQSWAVMRETIPLGKSQNPGKPLGGCFPRYQSSSILTITPERIKANLAVKKLPEEDFDALSNLKLKGDEGRTIDYSENWDVKFFV